MKGGGAHVASLRAQLETARADLRSERNKVAAHKVTIAQLEEELAVARAAIVALPPPTPSGPVDWAEGHATEPCARPHVERQRLPDEREGRTYKLRIGSVETLCPECHAPLPGSRISAHLTVNRYADGRPAEVFLSMDRSRRGEVAATLGHQLAIALSVGLQHGIPLDVFVRRLRHVRDDSGGIAMREVDGRLVPCENPRTVGSLVDLIAVTLDRFANGNGGA